MAYPKYIVAVLALVAVAMIVSACGGETGGAGSATRAVNVGGGQKVEVQTGKPLKIAFFVQATNNSYFQANIAGAKERAKKLGVNLDVFDGKFDATTQANQMQNALTRGYDAWIVQAVEGTQVCDVATKQAPQQGILVSVVTLPVCGRSTKDGEATWAPGTLNFVGGLETPASFKAVLEKAVSDNPGPQKVGVLTGQDINPITLSLEKALKEVTTEHPEFKVVAKERTDYTVPVAQQKAETMIQANPDLNIIFDAYSNLSKGVVPALQAAGRSPGEIKIYETGGTTWAVGALKEGWVQATTARYPRTMLEASVQSLVDAQKERSTPHFVANDGHPLDEPGRKKKDPVYIVTRENVGSYRAESD